MVLGIGGVHSQALAVPLDRTLEIATQVSDSTAPLT